VLPVLLYQTWMFVAPATTTTSVAVTVIAAHKSAVTDTATVTSNSFDPNPANNSASVSVLIK
jgi:hypothetical protein